MSLSQVWEFFRPYQRVLKYIFVRALTTIALLAIGLYLAVIVVNFGGFIDDIYRANIDEAIQFTIPPEGLSKAEVERYFGEIRVSMEKAYGLDKPFLLRCVRWAWDAGTFQWGRAVRLKNMDRTSSDIRVIVNEGFANTMLLFGTANLLLFFASLSLAFALSRRFGSRLDNILSGLTVVSSVPPWIHGAVLTLVLAFQFRLLPFGGMFDNAPPGSAIGYIFVIARHMVLPVLAIFLGLFFQLVAVWRGLFLLQITEDYLELAKAKGLPDKLVNRFYILRPTLPYVVTTFAMLMVGVWQNSIALEVWFHWPGIGQLLYLAIGEGTLDRSLVLAIVVTFAYILAGTVIVLDVLYAFLDPRIRVGVETRDLHLVRSLSRLKNLNWRRTRLPSSVQVSTSTYLPSHPRISWNQRWHQRWEALRPFLGEIFHSPAALFGLALICVLMGFSAYAVIAIPYEKIVALWRPEPQTWSRNPKYAAPLWTNYFRKDPLPENIMLDSRTGNVSKELQTIEGLGRQVTYSFQFDYPYGEVPQDFVLNIHSDYAEKRPFITLDWFTPDGRNVSISNFAIDARDEAYYLFGDQRLARRYGTSQAIMNALFTDPVTGNVVRGQYRLRLRAILFESDSHVEAELMLFGKVFGIAGTDRYRRDLSLALLWGAPVALTFGIAGAIFSTLATVALAAASGWFGGWVDGLIQRLTEISMILPALPIAMMVYFIYSKSVWAILGVIVLLSIFGSSLKNYRAIFLQTREAPYVEAARAYGATDWRIIRAYLLPRVLPVLFPQLIVLVPTFIFLEATLAFLQVSDIYLPTWGKLIYEAILANALQGYPHMLVEPLVLLLLTGLAFSLLGLALDRILNPKLRGH